MPLYKLHSFDPDYRSGTNENDVKGFDVYSQDDNDKIGSVHEILVDEEGRFRYLVVETGFWVFGKRVMLPIGLTRIDEKNHRVYANLTRDRVENLPEFSDDLKIDRNYEEQVRNVYRPSRSANSVVDTTAPLNTSYTGSMMGVDQVGVDNVAAGNAPLSGNVDNTVPLTTASTDANTSDVFPYYEDASLYDVNERDHQSLKLYQERLIANKQRVKTGEVAVGKRVTTETQHVSVPVEKERVVVERTNRGDVAGTAVDAADFSEGEVARLEVYEEVADIRTEPFVREEVQVRKEVSQETVDQEATVRREELDIKTDGTPVVDKHL